MWVVCLGRHFRELISFSRLLPSQCLQNVTHHSRDSYGKVQVASLCTLRTGTITPLLNNLTDAHCLPTRSLITEAKPHDAKTVSIKEVRNKLKALAGSPEVWPPEKDTGPPPPPRPDVLPARTMADSYREALIPLGQDRQLRDNYVNVLLTARLGRIMEDLDTMAVYLGYSHNRDEDKPGERTPISIVTASVDRIDIVGQEDPDMMIRPDQDLRLRGHVTWVGSTSMEISMQVDQMREAGVVHLIDAKFLMVARDPYRNMKARVNPLIATTPEETKFLEEGKAAQTKRKQQSKDSLLKQAPTEEEIKTIHNLFLETIDTGAATFKKPVKPEGSVWMEDSMLKNVIICFPEQRNLYSKIFGGFLMRQAMELAWANVRVYTKSRPILLAVDDILFKESVNIGDLLYLSSQVAYTEGNRLQVRVHAEVVQPKSGTHKTTNVFHFTFYTSKPAPRVMPKSYAEYMMFLDAKRHYEESMKNRKG